MTYAKDTTVSVEASRAEIERILRRYKAEGFYYASEADRAMIAFRMAGRMVRFTIKLPSRADKAFTTYMRGSVRYQREPNSAEKLWEQACRQKWRALALVIKAKLEAVEAGITTVEDEFLAATLLADGRTYGEHAKAELDRIYAEGGMPRPLMLEGPKE